MSRKMASVQRIIAVDPIEKADRIVRLTVNGWQLVSNKENNFKVGDLVIYFEIDSICPEKPEFEFLRERHFRIRTIRLRGVLSQGLAMPLAILPAGDYKEGDDVSEILGITKHEPIQTAAREIEGPFPTHFFPKTDEVRIQNILGIFEELKGVPCYSTVKMDGQSLTFAHYDDGGVILEKVCTRNFSLKDIEGSPHWKCARDLKIFETLPLGFAISGEFVGEGIQANRVGIKGKQFLAFNVFDIVKQRFFDFADFVKFCAERSIPTVPIENPSFLLDEHNLESLLKMSEGLYHGTQPREGLVIRPCVERASKVISDYEGKSNATARCSFKVINNVFLLKTED